MALMRYKGDVGDRLPKVLGGRWKVQSTSYDPDLDVTVVEVLPLVDPLKAAGLSD
jgi:hypothetical protein